MKIHVYLNIKFSIHEYIYIYKYNTHVYTYNKRYITFNG